MGCGAYESIVAEQLLKMPWKTLTSVDGYENDLNKARTEKTSEAKEHIFIHSELTNWHIKAADYAFLLDVIEHIDKKKGIKLLKDLQKKCENIFILAPVEPDGFHRDNPFPDNVLQEHISHWDQKDFEALGFDVEYIPDFHTDTQGDVTINFGGIWATYKKKKR